MDSGDHDPDALRLAVSFTKYYPALLELLKKNGESPDLVDTVAVRPRKSAAGKGTFTDTGPLRKIRVAIPRTVSTDVVQGRVLEFQADSTVLEEMSHRSGAEILHAFESDPGNVLAQLPACRLREKMECLTGKSDRKSIDISHIPRAADLVYEIVRRKDMGARQIDNLILESIDQSSLYLQCDFDSKEPFEGVQDPAIAVWARDLYEAGHSCCIVGPKYRWCKQLIRDIPSEDLEDKFYSQPLCGLGDDGTKVADVFRVAIEDKPKPIAIASGYNKPLKDTYLMAGSSSNILVRAGMGISFTLEACNSPLRDVITCGGNPNMKVCHGFIVGMVQDADGQPELCIRLALHKTNLPPFLAWHRLSEDAVLQTNLEAVIPASWVVSQFRISPITLFTMPERTKTTINSYKKGSLASPIRRNVFIAGHLDLFPGESRPRQNGSPPNELWNPRHENGKLKAFSLLSEFCLRGGEVTDPAFPDHKYWKQRMSKTMQTVSHFLPRAELHRVCTFPTTHVLDTIQTSQSLLESPIYDPFLSDLHSAVKRLAESKAKRARNCSGPACVLPLFMRGEMLMQLVHKYAPLNTVRFKEGAVEAVLQHFQQAEELLGSKDGIFKLDGFGMVQLCAPITARWVLYNTKGVDAISFGAEGRAELEFKRYIGMDRMGGELTGDLSGNGCITAGGRGKSSGGAPAGSKQEKSPAGALQNATVPFAGGREVMAAEPAAPPAKEVSVNPSQPPGGESAGDDGGPVGDDGASFGSRGAAGAAPQGEQAQPIIQPASGHSIRPKIACRREGKGLKPLSRWQAAETGCRPSSSSSSSGCYSSSSTTTGGGGGGGGGTVTTWRQPSRRRVRRRRSRGGADTAGRRCYRRHFPPCLLSEWGSRCPLSVFSSSALQLRSLHRGG
jgi:hypothetical protein